MRKLAATAVFLAVLALPIAASADTREDLQRQLIQVLTQLITLLQMQIAQLQGQGQTQVQYQNQCPTPPEEPVISCSATWQKINDLRSCHVGWSCIVYSVQVQGKNVEPPIISAIQGPIDNLVNTAGTWKVTAVSPAHQTLSYSVIYGDEGVNISKLLDFAAGGTGDYVSSNSFTHAYQTAGSYTIIVFAKDTDGNITKATMTIYVNNPPPPPPPTPPKPTIDQYQICDKIDLANTDPDVGPSVLLPGFAVNGDTTNAPQASNVMLFEDKIALGPAHSTHDSIRDSGKGQFSHWYNSLYYSSSDGSDPRRNGRDYIWGIPKGAGSCPVRLCNYNHQAFPDGSIRPFGVPDWYPLNAQTRIPESAMVMKAINCVACSPGHFAQYKCTNGNWLLVSTGSPYPYPIALKPVIYLYPTRTEEVTVQLTYKGELSSTYPSYDTALHGWKVLAHPDGTLFNLADNREYSYLFWEGKDYKFDIDRTKGFVVKGSDTKQFLQTKLAELGLTAREYNEFIVFWLPRMEHNAYNYVQFLGSEYTDVAPLAVTPKPDSILRVFMAYKPLNQYLNVTPQTIKPFERKGFSVVEWGGTEMTD